MPLKTLSPLKKINLVLLVGGVVALLILIAYLNVSLRQSAVERWQQDVLHSVRQLAGWVDSEFDQARERLEYIANRPEFTPPLDRQLVDRKLNGIPQSLDPGRRISLQWTLEDNSHGFNVLFVLFANGDHYLSHPYRVQKELKTYNLSHREYFRRATAMKKSVLSNTFVGADGVPAVAIDVPILDPQGEILSHLGGVMYLNQMTSLFSSQGRMGLGETYFMLDRVGNEVVKTGLSAGANEHIRQLVTERDAWQELDQGYAYRIGALSEAYGREQLLVLVRLQSGWTLGVVSNFSAVAEQFASNVEQTALIAAMLILLIIGASILLVRQIGARWQAAEREVQLSNQKLEQRVEERTHQLILRENAVQDARQRLQDIIEATQVGTWEWNLQEDSCHFNERWAGMLGYTLDELKPHNYACFTNLLHPDDLPEVEREMELHLQGKQATFQCEMRMKHKQGQWIWVQSKGRITALDQQGKPQRISGTHTEISDRKAAEHELKMAASVFSHAREGIMITDADARIIEVNETFTDLTGYSREEVLGQNPRILRSGMQSEAFYQDMWQHLQNHDHWNGEIWNRKKSGQFYAELLTISAVRDRSGKLTNYVALFSDITHSKMNEQRLEHVAHYDALTDLPNRILLADRLGQALIQADREQEQVVVAYLDLDGFKDINDCYGHDQGDLLLIEVARRMKACLRRCDTIARLGGDEFVAVLTGFKQVADASALLERLLRAAARPVQSGELSLQVSASLGVTYYPQDEEISADQLMRQADQAMYQAKLEGKNCYHFFNPEQDRAAKGLNASLQSIRQGLEQGEFVVYYQPKIRLATGEVVGMEALVRWQHPQRGLLSPAEFLPLIEEHALSVELGQQVLSQVLSQLANWREQGVHLRVSVNISSIEIQDERFMQRLRQKLSAYPKLEPGCLQLEILETCALKDIEKVSRTMKECRAMGVQFSLDDFGTGYSSLTYLKRLPAAELKIDQSFVRDMLEDPDDLAIIEGVLGLARAFGRQVIAEGVESTAHGVRLLQLGCEYAQGYAIARPMPADQIAGWMETWRNPAEWTAIAEA
ncbi:bifunctional diguanylate cyclase/phosphodiesterase [Neptuniibacter halophilus]|uniref:bifunctional diguanylate cyclase/phosphodiesterase n=1 Tax=Neptuniibacter halophilus TaxID=651666 RepID=UPI00257294A9|nr:EAL domain-containing protein [Neptuniibacter halophilus]